MSLKIHPIWFDSMGAKSSCTLVSTPDISVLIDPGIAVMQPSFPASNLKKTLWMKKGKSAIKKQVKRQISSLFRIIIMITFFQMK